MRALIADDDRGTTAVLSKTLRRWGMDIIVANDGNAAWDILRGGDGPPLAIIDWMMPGVDGPELCRRIRGDASLSHMYVILLTGRDRRADVVAGLDAGADDYVVKPFDVDELRARIHVGLRVLTLQERLKERADELLVARNDLRHVVSTDALTGAASRRHWIEMAEIEFSRFRRYGRPLGLIMADLDLFKRVNDTYGHDIGDAVLRRFAEVLRTECRQSDVTGRMGGEEFCVLLPESSAGAAEEVARRIVEACRNIVVPSPNGPVTFTCSIGVTDALAVDASIDDVLRRADRALYAAKDRGRDRWEVGTAEKPDGESTHTRRELRTPA
jgi:diguanylate cyclase (GGDEF)-like protein